MMTLSEKYAEMRTEKGLEANPEAIKALNELQKALQESSIITDDDMDHIVMNNYFGED